MKMILNIVAFQVGWFACVLGGATDRPWAAVAVAVALIAIHLHISRWSAREALLILLVGVVGFFWDSLLVRLDLLVYPSGALWPQTAPVWIVAIWMLFATTLNVSLAWLKPRLWLAALFGAVAAPLAYLGGAKLGGVVMPNPSGAITALAIGWAVGTPLLLRLSDWVSDISTDRMRTSATQESEPV
jgi:hypothetical protein